ncbi:hypothetical protein SteCoe_9491 [Stentor coeruleus]|uniref:Acyl-coenzyme A oxidase n=1 Tax=Stentor coeruleus TaxID=5963 RepID=A0A1R2CHR6_9CILI|nr:hypothetical protein SteCoe_9491 [Stentor coeruleus]
MALVEERKSTTLSMEELTRFIYAHAYSETPLERIREIREKMAKIPELSLTVNRYYDTREQSLKRALLFGNAWVTMIKKEKLNHEELQIAYENSFELTAHIAHITFFVPSLILQADNDQLREWMPLCETMEMVGCYAQTELGHGSDVRGLEIQATYDHLSKSFILHSPTITATKWWIGALGCAANHALVIAQLYINGTCYGPHPFLVPIRDIKTHMPYDGVDVGDIGPKIGFHSNDNGFLRFNNYRIPKKYMLTRFSKINDTGDYEIIDPNSIKILYLSLVRARLFILADAWFPLSSALTIAIRYSIIRKQFADNEKPGTEKKIIDYQIQQNKLFVMLSRLFAFLFVRVPINNMYFKIEKEVTSGKSPSLDILHCLVCLYKVYASSKVLEAIETCRRACGGHGYSMLSGIPSLYTTFLPKVTYDGDNNILSLQVIKYLVSLFHKKSPKEFAYITGAKITPTGDVHSSSFQQQCFMAVAQYKVNRVNKHFQELKTRFTKEKIWNSLLQVEGIEATEPVFHAHIHQCFIDTIDKLPNGTNKDALECLRKIYVASEIEKYSGILMNCGVKYETFETIQQDSVHALSLVRPNALGLIEAFELKDEALHSILGRKDGDVYNQMFQNVKTQNPINKTKVLPGLLDYLRPKI